MSPPGSRLFLSKIWKFLKWGPFLRHCFVGSGKMLKDLADLKKDKLPLTWPKVIYYIVNFVMATSIGIAVTVLGRRALADLEIREAAEREEGERQMRGVVEDVEEVIDTRGMKKTRPWT